MHGAVARLAEGAYGRLDADGQRSRARILLRLAGEGEGDAVVRGPRARSSEFGERGPAPSSTCSPTAACSRSARARSRSRTRRCCASGRGCAAGSRRTPRAGACTATSAPPRASGTPAAATRGELYRGARLAAALDWAADHDPELNASERAFLDESRDRERARAPPPADGAWRASPRCSSLARRSRGAVALDSAATRATQATAADAQRLGAQALAEDDLDRSLLLARQGVGARRLAADARQPARRAAASPAAIGVLRGDGDALIGLDLSPDGRTLALIDNDGTLRFVDHADAAPGGAGRSPPPARGLRHRRGVALRPAALQPRRLAGRGRRRRAGRPGRPDPSRPRPPADRHATASSTALRFSPDGGRSSPSSGSPPAAVSSCCASTRAPAAGSAAGALGRRRRLRELDGHARRPALVTPTPRRTAPSSATPARCGCCGACPAATQTRALSPERSHAAARRRATAPCASSTCDREGPHRLRTPQRRGRARHFSADGRTAITAARTAA